MKKIVSLLLSLVLMMGMLSSVYAENELAKAKSYSLGNSAIGNIVEGNENDVYKFNLATSGTITINFFGDMERATLKLYDETGKELWNETPYWNNTTEEISFTNDLCLCKGGYYFSVSKSWGKWEGSYNFTITETAIYETFPEEQNGSNNSTKTADLVTDGLDYIGCIAINDNVDVYKFEITSAGKLDINLFADMERVDLKLYDATAKEIWKETPHWNNTTEEISYTKDLYLCKGIYYLSVSKSWGKCEGSYSYKLLFTSANESFSEVQNGSNNKFSAASLIAINQKYNGFLALNDELDFYKIQINDSKSTFFVSADLERVELKLYDETGKELWKETPHWNNTTEEINFTKELNLQPGAYVLSVAKSWGKTEGNFTFWFTNGGAVQEPILTESTITVKIDSVPVVFDQPPIIENGRTLVPLRAIFEALGAEVLWDGNTQTVTATKGGVQISLQIGSNQMYVNGTVKTLDVPAKLINSRTLVPVRAISEAFGCEVEWIQSSQTVVISR